MKRIGYMPPRTYHFRPQSRTPQSHAYHFRPRVGAYCIRPTNVFDRKRTPCICVIHFRMYAGFMRFCVIHFRAHECLMRFCTYSPRSGSFVGRIQYAPTRGRKRYAQDVVILARVHGTFVRFCTYSSRSGSFVGRMLLRPTRGHETFVRVCTYSPRSGSFVGRMQYAPTRGRKWYAWNGVIRARLRETVVRFYGIRDRGHEMVVHIGLSLFFGR